MGWANQTRLLSLQFDELKATVGQGLINAFTPVLRVINNVIGGLQTMANAFKALTEALFGSAGDSTGATGAGKRYDAIADGMNDVADGVGAVGGAAKKANKELASFDKLEILGSEAGGGRGGGGPAGGGNFDFGLGFDPKKQTAVDKAAEKMAKNIKKYLEPLQKIDFSDLKTSIDKLKKSLDPFERKFFEGLDWAYQNIFVPLAKWTSEELLPAFLDTLSGAVDFLDQTLELFEPAGEWLFDNFLRPLAEWEGGLVVGLLNDVSKALGKITGWESDNEVTLQKIITFFTKIGTVITVSINPILMMKITIETVTALMRKFAEVAGQAWEKIKEIFSPAAYWLNENLVKPIKEKVGGAWSAVKEKASTAWSGIKAVFSPAVTWFSTLFGSVKKTVSDIWGNIKAIISGVWTSVKLIWGAASGWFKGNVTDPIKTKFTDAWSTARRKAGEAWGAIKSVFSPAIDWFKTTFQKAWAKVISVFEVGGQIFTDIKDAISSTFKRIVNQLIDGINHVVAKPFEAINKALMRLKATSILGRYPFRNISSISIPKIPHLARGAVIPPNSEFLAVLGDQKRGNNIETPEALLRQIMREESGNRQDEIIDLLRAILEHSGVYLDGRKLSDTVTMYQRQSARAIGG